MSSAFSARPTNDRADSLARLPLLPVTHHAHDVTLADGRLYPRFATRAGSGFTRCSRAAAGRCWPRSCGPAMLAPTTLPITCRCSRQRWSSSRSRRLRGRPRALGLGRRQPRAGRRVPRDAGALLDRLPDRRAGQDGDPGAARAAWRPAINADGQRVGGRANQPASTRGQSTRG
jgi:hypothetical protein